MCLNLFLFAFLFLVTPCLVVAVHPCMEWIPIKKKILPNCWGIAPKEPTTNGIVFTFTFQIFCNSLLRSCYFSIFFFSFSSILLSRGTAKSLILQVLLFLSTTTKSSFRAFITKHDQSENWDPTRFYLHFLKHF